MSNMTIYEWQRFVFRKAVKNGWNGTEPGVLGGYDATRAFENAERFLIAKGLLIDTDVPQEEN